MVKLISHTDHFKVVFSPEAAAVVSSAFSVSLPAAAAVVSAGAAVVASAAEPPHPARLAAARDAASVRLTNLFFHVSFLLIFIMFVIFDYGSIISVWPFLLNGILFRKYSLFQSRFHSSFETDCIKM